MVIALLGAIALAAVFATAASADHGTRVDFSRVQIDCRQHSTRVTPFMEMDVSTTWNAASAEFSGRVFTVPRSGGTRQDTGSISGRTTATTISFTVVEQLRHAASATFPAPSQGADARATPVSVKLTGPVTVTGQTGETFACTWTSDARLSVLAHAASQPGAGAAVSPAATSAARTLGPAPAPADGADLPVVPLLVGGLIVAGGGVVLLRTLRPSPTRSAPASSVPGAPVVPPVPNPMRFGLPVDPSPRVGPEVVVSNIPIDERLATDARVKRRAGIQRGIEAAEKDAAFRDLDAGFASLGEAGAGAVGTVADQGVSILKELTGTPGRIVDATYTGAKGAAGALAEGKSAGEAIASGLGDVAKGQLSDAIGGAAKLGGAKITGKVEVPAPGGPSLGEGLTGYVEGQATSAGLDAALDRPATPPDGPKRTE